MASLRAETQEQLEDRVYVNLIAEGESSMANESQADAEIMNYRNDPAMIELVPGVFIAAGDGVYIVDPEIGEVVSWNSDEVAEDGEAFTAAVVAAVIAAVKSPAAVRDNIQSGGQVLQQMLVETANGVRTGPVVRQLVGTDVYADQAQQHRLTNILDMYANRNVYATGLLGEVLFITVTSTNGKLEWAGDSGQLHVWGEYQHDRYAEQQAPGGWVLTGLLDKRIIKRLDFD